MTARRFSVVGWLAGGVAATSLVLGCSSGGGRESLVGDACVAGVFGGGNAYVECLRSECPGNLDELETGCAGYFECACPGGAYDPSTASSPSCTPQTRSPSCESAVGQVSCSACEGAATGSSGAVASSGGGTSSGSSSGTGSSSGASSGAGSNSGSSGNTGGGSSGGDEGAGSSSGTSSGSGSSSGSNCDVTCTPSNSCDSDGTCADGAKIQNCVSIDSCCNTTCYYTVGGQRITCASCGTDDVVACVGQLYDECE